MGTLEILHLTKRFGNHTVLNGLSLTVAEGEFFVLLGPSGGGKSTILKTVCGIEQPDAGQILLDGRDLTRLPPRDRNIGMVFQDYGLYPHMSVFENIAYGLEARGMAKAEVSQRVTAAAGKLGLTPHIQRVVVDLSGGEQQRVALARALAKDADLYLFDEPISNLDPKLRAQARRDILMVHRAKGKPTLYVTHDQTEALAIGDRIGIVANGQLQQVGAAEDLTQRPANLFVAGFIGTPSMNLLRGAVAFDSVRDEYQVNVSPQLALRLPGKWKPALQAYYKDRLVVGIPPLAFFTPESAEGGGQLHLEGEIEFVEPLVSELIVVVALQPGVPASAMLLNADESQFQIGNRLRLGVDSEQFCLFDPDTEQALVHAG
jgi:ABC-type sugar transport system ATPase subunit